MDLNRELSKKSEGPGSSRSVEGTNSTLSHEDEEDVDMNRDRDFETDNENVSVLEDDSDIEDSDNEMQKYDLEKIGLDKQPENIDLSVEKSKLDLEKDNKEITEVGAKDVPHNDIRFTEEEAERADSPTQAKKSRKTKKKIEKRTAFDGRDVVFVTEFTQTDWRWKDKTEKNGKGKVIIPRTVKTESREAVSRTHTEGESTIDTRTTTDVTPFSLQPNDEFGIPILDMSSDSDSSDEDAPKKSHRHHLPTIGPPQILKYVRESDRADRNMERGSSELDDECRISDSANLMSSGASPGMFGGLCEFCRNDIKPFPSLEQQLSMPPESLYCCEEYRDFVEFTMTTANKLEEDIAKKNEKISIKVHAHHGSKQARKMAKEQAVQRMRERELQRRQQEATGLQAAYFNLARQMKTINYQLSSQRCLEEGWTMRVPSPLNFDDTEAEVFIPEPLHPSIIASGKLYDRPLIEKFYPDGSKFLTMFPDGTGNVFYPSGCLAIVILSTTLGQYSYIVYDNGDDPETLAVFGPNGIGFCQFAHGKIRLTIDQIEGLELDATGGKKRLWSWRDQETHVHAPPFQPVVFAMNRHIGIRIMAQENIALTLSGKKRSCRFNVGAKLKLVSPENAQPKTIDMNQLFIDERKVRVDSILDKVSTLLKFPKSPKVDRILPPLSISSRQHRVEKLRKEVASLSQGQISEKDSKKDVRKSCISPLPVISVN